MIRKLSVTEEMKISQRVTHAVPRTGHQVAASHSHSSGQPLQNSQV